jgi:hypothetical protein
MHVVMNVKGMPLKWIIAGHAWKLAGDVLKSAGRLPIQECILCKFYVSYWLLNPLKIFSIFLRGLS